MKSNDIIALGGLVGLLWFLNKHNAAQQPATVRTATTAPATGTATKPATTAQGILDFGGGGFSLGGGGGGDRIVGQEQDLRIAGYGYDIFDMLDLWARQSAPTYRDEYPNAPGVIHVDSEQ